VVDCNYDNGDFISEQLFKEFYIPSLGNQYSLIILYFNFLNCIYFYDPYEHLINSEPINLLVYSDQEFPFSLNTLISMQ
jgi:hypothetical protein